MTKLNLATNLTDRDDLYESIIGLFDSEPDAQNLKTAAKLVLLLANHIGDEAVVREAIDLARPSSVDLEKSQGKAG